MRCFKLSDLLNALFYFCCKLNHNIESVWQKSLLSAFGSKVILTILILLSKNKKKAYLDLDQH